MVYSVITRYRILTYITLLINILICQICQALKQGMTPRNSSRIDRATSHDWSNFSSLIVQVFGPSAVDAYALLESLRLDGEVIKIGSEIEVAEQRWKRWEDNSMSCFVCRCCARWTRWCQGYVIQTALRVATGFFSAWQTVCAWAVLDPHLQKGVFACRSNPAEISVQQTPAAGDIHLQVSSKVLI